MADRNKRSRGKLRTINERAELWQVSPRTKQRLIKSGALRASRIGRLVRISTRTPRTTSTTIKTAERCHAKSSRGLMYRVFRDRRENTQQIELPFTPYISSRKSPPVRLGPTGASGVRKEEAHEDRTPRPRSVPGDPADRA
jgi:excisionase family DNA binding protein